MSFSFNLTGLAATAVGLFLLLADSGFIKLGSDWVTSKQRVRKWRPVFTIVGAIVTAYGLATLFGLF